MPNAPGNSCDIDIPEINSGRPIERRYVGILSRTYCIFSACRIISHWPLSDDSSFPDTRKMLILPPDHPWSLWNHPVLLFCLEHRPLVVAHTDDTDNSIFTKA